MTSQISISFDDAKKLLALVAEADRQAAAYCMPAFMQPEGESEKFLANMEALLGQSYGYRQLVRRNEIKTLAPADLLISLNQLRDIAAQKGYKLVPTANGKFVLTGIDENIPVEAAWYELISEHGLEICWNTEYQEGDTVVYKPDVWNPEVQNVLQHQAVRFALPGWLGLKEVTLQLPPYKG